MNEVEVKVKVKSFDEIRKICRNLKIKSTSHYSKLYKIKIVGLS